MNKYADLYDSAPDCPKCNKKMTYVYGGDRTEIGPLCLDCRCDKAGGDLSEFWGKDDNGNDSPVYLNCISYIEHTALVHVDTDDW